MTQAIPFFVFIGWFKFSKALHNGDIITTRYPNITIPDAGVAKIKRSFMQF